MGYKKFSTLNFCVCVGDSGTCSWVLLLVEVVCGNLLHLRLHISHTVVHERVPMVSHWSDDWRRALAFFGMGLSMWVSTLQVCQTVGLMLFKCLILSLKECPCHVYSDSMPTKQITGQYIYIYNVQQSHQQLWSQVMIAHNILNGSMSPWTWCSWQSIPH